MQKLVTILLIAILAGSVTIPNVFSDDEKNNNGTNGNDNNENQNGTKSDDHENQNGTKENENHDDNDNKTKIRFGFSNATSISIPLPNGTTITFGFSNGTNVGQQISAFIHQIRDAFKQQETQAKQLIKDCREKAKEASSPADRKIIMDQCKVQLKQVNQQFKGEHKQFQTDFKQFREMVVGNNQENHEKPDQKNETKIHFGFSNSTQTGPKQHGHEQKLEHGKQNETKKHGKED